jgi:hypothetical protein
MEPVLIHSGYSRLVQSLSQEVENFGSDSKIIVANQEQDLWESFKQAFIDIAVFIITGGKSGERWGLTLRDMSAIREFLRFANYQIVNEFLVQPKRIGDLCPNLPEFIANSSLILYSSYGGRIHVKISVPVTSMFQVQDELFTYPIDRNIDSSMMLAQDINQCNWGVAVRPELSKDAYKHSFKAMVQAGRVDLFIRDRINENPQVQENFLAFLLELNLRGIQEELCNLENSMERHVNPAAYETKIKELNNLRNIFTKRIGLNSVENMPLPTVENKHLFKYSFFPKVILENNIIDFSKSYECSPDDLKWMVSFYTDNFLTEKADLDLIASLVQAVGMLSEHDMRFFYSRVEALGIESKKEILGVGNLDTIERKLQFNMPYKASLEKIADMRYDVDQHQLLIEGTLTLAEYHQLVAKITPDIVTATQIEGAILIQFKQSMSSFVSKSSAINSIRDQESEEYQNLYKYINYDIYKEVENHDLKPQEAFYRHLMKLKEEAVKHNKDYPLGFGQKDMDHAREKAINERFEMVTQIVLEQLLLTIETLLR